MDKRSLDDILTSRYTPNAPDDLSARIIAAARAVPQEVSWFKRMQLQFESFVGGVFAPQPAFAFAVVAFVLIGAGVFGSTYWTFDETTNDVGDVSLAFYVDDILGADDYL
ncbi:MAG: hypothetical protein ACPGRX_08445 [Bdellovibrionales bacterium]